MNRPPILETGNPQPPQQMPNTPIEKSPPQKPADSPLASQLPLWDLTPAHTLLVRRRMIKK